MLKSKTRSVTRWLLTERLLFLMPCHNCIGWSIHVNPWYMYMYVRGSFFIIFSKGATCDLNEFISLSL